MLGRQRSQNFVLWLCWGGRPPTASMCQNEVVEISRIGTSSKGAVHERYYPNWSGYVQECFSATRRECCGTSGAAQEAAPARLPELFRKAAADQGRPGSLRRVALLGARVDGAGGRGEAAAAPVREDLCTTQQKRQ